MEKQVDYKMNDGKVSIFIVVENGNVYGKMYKDKVTFRSTNKLARN